MRVGGSMWMWYDLCHLRTLEADLRGRPEAIQRPPMLGFWLEISFLTTEWMDIGQIRGYGLG